MLTKIREDLGETQGENPFPGLTTHAYPMDAALTRECAGLLNR